jgi:hypothetical protein
MATSARRRFRAAGWSAERIVPDERMKRTIWILAWFQLFAADYLMKIDPLETTLFMRLPT